MPADTGRGAGLARCWLNFKVNTSFHKLACTALLTTDPQRQDLGCRWTWILPVLHDESTDVKQVRNRNMHFLDTGAWPQTLSHQEVPFRHVEEAYTDLATFHNNLSDEKVARLSGVREM
jgi:hypothetical protein